MILVPALADIERRTTSNAERTVARLLRDVVGDPDSAAFHSVDLRSHAYKQQAEADFIVLWRGVVVVIEVKGGGVRKHDGVWYSVDRRGDWHKLAGSPMEQARSAAYALRDILQEEGVGWFAHEAIVITPDIDSPPNAVGWRPTHWLARDDMTSAGLGAALDRVVDNARAAPNGQKRARMGDLRTRMFGEFTRMPVIDAQRGAVIEEQNRATAGQARVLAALARNPRVLVYGGAGTGKSLVLVEAAKQEKDQGKSVLITFHSPALTRFFAPHVEGREIDLIPLEKLPADKSYDVVLVDEAQDMMTADAMDRIDAVIDGGRARGRWRMFLDPNNQAHVDGGYDDEVAELIADEAIAVDLDLNVRNTHAIVHVVQEYLGADIGDPGIVHGEKVQWHNAASDADITEADLLAKQIVADGANRADLWLISTTTDGPPSTSPGGFVLTSPKHAKGLEAEHVIVFDLPETYDEAGTAAFYVAVTRARVSLHIITSKDDKRGLQQLSKNRMMAK
ncbi:nuclease-related domain-containing DEAD/DEAH box helicase [Nocardioides sp.]|uniref:nuclease-related domain-containing DEAD/DEAH box helicase n=1 Tax=Nocardioides sp. TaxID=35761 RepID=UPI00198EC8B8|nr:NERD domain-containing protein/DEAD/DEAH box helicase [Nocardioides sp.]MBC7276387.1 NERD domain-containing protein [Nocardioides sp.]